MVLRNHLGTRQSRDEIRTCEFGGSLTAEKLTICNKISVENLRKKYRFAGRVSWRDNFEVSAHKVASSLVSRSVQFSLDSSVSSDFDWQVDKVVVPPFHRGQANRHQF